MMTPDQHYAEAERLLKEVDNYLLTVPNLKDKDYYRYMAVIQTGVDRAKVHATLATVR